MTIKQHRQRVDLEKKLFPLGFSVAEVAELVLLAKRFHTWDERLCEDTQINEATGKAERRCPLTYTFCTCINNGARAQARLADLLSRHPDIVARRQTDPRGCSLYINEIAVF